MRHYEIVFLVHPDQSEQVPAMLDRYRSMIETSGGSIHRQEDWGRRQLAYPINKIHKAHYLMLNIECDRSALEELVGAFRFSDAVLRHMVINREAAISEPSFMAIAEEESKAKPEHRSEKPDAEDKIPDAETKENIVEAAESVEDEPIEPAAVEPAAVEPAAVEPAAVEPAAVEPEAVEPAAAEASDDEAPAETA